MKGLGHWSILAEHCNGIFLLLLVRTRLTCWSYSIDAHSPFRYIFQEQLDYFEKSRDKSFPKWKLL